MLELDALGPGVSLSPASMLPVLFASATVRFCTRVHALLLATVQCCLHREMFALECMCRCSLPCSVQSCTFLRLFHPHVQFLCGTWSKAPKPNNAVPQSVQPKALTE